MNVTVTLPPPPRDEPRLLPAALAVAFGLHASLAVFTPKHSPAEPAARAPTMEVELAAPKPPAAPPPVPVKEAEAPPAHAAPPSGNPPPRGPARAGKVLTAEGPRADDSPLDFVTDPNGTTYGYGVVAKGGTAEVGVAAPVASAAPLAVRAAPVSDLVGAADLTERPRLASDDRCRGYYRASALVDSAAAVVRVTIEPSGKVRRVDLVSESPAGQGFGGAARQCLATQRFSPAKDRDGKAVATATTVRLHFAR